MYFVSVFVFAGNDGEQQEKEKRSIDAYRGD